MIYFDEIKIEAEKYFIDLINQTFFYKKLNESRKLNKIECSMSELNGKIIKKSIINYLFI